MLEFLREELSPTDDIDFAFEQARVNFCGVLDHPLLPKYIRTRFYPPQLLEKRTVLLPEEQYNEVLMSSYNHVGLSADDLTNRERLLRKTFGAYIYDIEDPAQNAIIVNKGALERNRGLIDLEKLTTAVLAEELSHALAKGEVFPLRQLNDDSPLIKPLDDRKGLVARLNASYPFSPAASIDNVRVASRGFGVVYSVGGADIRVDNDFYHPYEETRAAILSTLLQILFFGQQIRTGLGKYKALNLPPAIDFVLGKDEVSAMVDQNSEALSSETIGLLFFELTFPGLKNSLTKRYDYFLVQGIARRLSILKQLAGKLTGNNLEDLLGFLEKERLGKENFEFLVGLGSKPAGRE